MKIHRILTSRMKQEEILVKKINVMIEIGQRYVMDESKIASYIMDGILRGTYKVSLYPATNID